MAESIAEFFEDDEIKRSVPANAAMIVQAYLTENTSVSDVAQALLAEFDAPGPDASKLWSLVCYIIVPLAEERPESHEGLVALLGELKGLIQQQQQQRQNDSSISTSSGNLKVKDLSLVYELYEVSLRYGDPDPSDLSMRELLQNEWASLNRFAALVHKENVESLSFWGQNTIEFAIRRGGWRINWKGPESISDKIQTLDRHAFAASHWIHLCGQQLYSEVPEYKARWTQWQEDLRWIIEQEGLTSDTRTVCQEVLREMERISSRDHDTSVNLKREAD